MIRTLRIQLTELCNFNCVYCCHEGTKSDFSILKNRNLISFIRACHDVLNIKRVKFTGGEPLEYDENINNIIKEVNREEIKYSIVTNATKYETFRRLIEECPHTEATISLPIPPNLNYINTFQNITGSNLPKIHFNNVIECINYMLGRNEKFKINYVLCRGENTSKEYINEMINFALSNLTINLRFLETAVNSTNNQEGIMRRYVFNQKDFENILCELGYEESVKNKKLDGRSSCIYDIKGIQIKLIKFFCSYNCEECPEDKTSLWLTSTGDMKFCSYKRTSMSVKNWKYSEITKQLDDIIKK